MNPIAAPSIAWIILGTTLQQASSPIVPTTPSNSDASTVGTNLTPAALISKMFDRYYNALSISGSIRMTQSAVGRSVVINSFLEYERPNKLYLRQVRDNSDSGEAILASNGKVFSYDRPADVKLGPPRFVEFTRNQYMLLDIRDMFTAAIKSIPDPNRILEVAIGRKGDLKDFIQELARFRFAPVSKIGDEPVCVIVGDWRIKPNDPICGSFELDITPEGDFRRYVLRRPYAVPNQPNHAPIVVETVWESSLNLSGKVDATLFNDPTLYAIRR